MSRLAYQNIYILCTKHEKNVIYIEEKLIFSLEAKRNNIWIIHSVF